MKKRVDDIAKPPANRATSQHDGAARTAPLSASSLARIVAARMLALRANHDPMMVLADKLASGAGNREDRVEFLRMFQARLKGLGQNKHAG